MKTISIGEALILSQIREEQERVRELDLIREGEPEAQLAAA